MDSQQRPTPNSPMDSHHHPNPDSPVDSQHHSTSDFPQAKKASKNPKRGIGGIGWAVLGVVVFGSLLAIGILPRISQQSELKKEVKAESAVPSVEVITPQRGEAATNLELPGSVVSLNQTTIYARTSGYLRRWLANLGDRVQKGQLLAEIDSPDVDQQVAQARADLAQAEANLVQSRANLSKGFSDLKQARANLLIALQTWQRWKVLSQEGVVSKQDADTRYATYKANLASVESAENTINSYKANVNAVQAALNSSRANFHRNAVLQSFEKVTAPFTGVITTRNVDAGVLITAGSGTSTNNTSLYTIAAYDTLNVNVSVPQTLAGSLQVGQTAKISVRELPQQVFIGKVIRTSNAIDPTTRTLLTQLEVPNTDDILRPGMYATAIFSIDRANRPLTIPASALVINAQGTQVATVTNNQTIHFQKVALGRDYGTEVDINSGLTGNEQILINPTVDQTEGLRVRPVVQKKKPPTQGK
ncbi:MAG: efflux RND transporter periplasmic adaptor subunit [Rhizonema sp. NSF051]|nr:efflux RND transporter periplasmic adaptor subunit [Rhizonema sp. NSF051]